MAVAGTITDSCSLTSTSTTATLGSVKDAINEGAPISIANGTSANQMNAMASGSLTLLANTPQTLDLEALASGTGTLNLATWKYIRLYNTDATNSVTVGPGDTNPATVPEVIAYPQSPAVLSCLRAGVAVDATHKTIKFDPGANAVTIEYVIGGTV